jgi:acyl dehydratase
MQFFEDMEVGAVERFGSYGVTREEVLEFARKYDPQPFHLDDAAAAKTFFGRIAASGWHSCAMTMAMVVEQQQRTGHQGMGSPGIDELRFVRPVYPGDTLRCERVTLSKQHSRSRPEMGIFTSRMQVFNQHHALVLSFVASAFVRVRDVDRHVSQETSPTP